MPGFDEDQLLLEEEIATETKPVYSQDYTTAMSHFYRGEVGRIMVWRRRLDTTTTWAITSTGTIFTVAFSFDKVPHLIFFFQLGDCHDDAVDRGAPLPVLRCLPRTGTDA